MRRIVRARMSRGSAPNRTDVVQLNADVEVAIGAQGGHPSRALSFEPRVLARAVAVPAATSVGKSALATLGRARVVAALKKIGWTAPTREKSNVLNAGLLADLLQRWST